MKPLRAFIVMVMLILLPQICAAQALSLRSQITDGDGVITAADVFENAEGLGNIVLGYRKGATTSLDAGAVQTTMMRAGGMWNNALGVRRIQVVAGADFVSQSNSAPIRQVVDTHAHTQDVLVFTRSMNSGDVVSASDIEFQKIQTHQVPQGAALDPARLIGKVVRYPLREGGVAKLGDVMSPIVIKRNESVAVTWSSGRVSLGMTGVAQKDGAVGDVIIVQNPISKKPIEILVTAPGQGVAGPLAQTLRQNMLMASQ